MGHGFNDLRRRVISTGWNFIPAVATIHWRRLKSICLQQRSASELKQREIQGISQNGLDLGLADPVQIMQTLRIVSDCWNSSALTSQFPIKICV
jgi:hypothetical protein